MKSIEVDSYAKINLSLNVLGKKDNMHVLDMVLSSIDLADKIYLKKREDNIINFESNILGENNNAVKALKLFKEEFDTLGYDLKIINNIPSEAGLGGSSADASGVLKALCVMYDIDLKDLRIKEIAKKVGSDVYPMLIGGYIRVKGIGDQVAKIDSKVKYKMLLLKNEKGVSTKECFDLFDNTPTSIFADNEKIEKLLLEDNNNIYPYMYNMLEDSAKKLNDEISRIKESVEKYNPVKVIMTGSGSGVIAFFKDIDDLESIAKELKNKVKYVKVIETKQEGVKVVNIN